MEAYGSDDGRSMAANNTSAYNCRRTTGGTGWSEHAYGRALDLNPVQNPYVRRTTVLPAQDGRTSTAAGPAPASSGPVTRSCGPSPPWAGSGAAASRA